MRLNFKGLILRKSLFMENDLIVQIINEDGENKEFIVKGAGQNSSKRRSHLDQLNYVSGSVFQKGQNSYLQEIQSINGFVSLKKDLSKAIKAQILSEFVNQNTAPEDAQKQIFDILLETLHILDTKSAHPLSAEIGILRLANNFGLVPDFKNCGACHSPIKDDSANFKYACSLTLCEKCACNESLFFPLKYRKALEFFKKNAQIESVKFSDEEIKHLQEWIWNLLKNICHKPLKSLQMFQSL